jgi:thioredoxin reductase (NADPH)
MERVALAIIGSGPAGLTAAIYSSRADLNPVVFEGLEPGGQLIMTTVIENFPGFPEGIDGSELMDNMRKQASRFGTRLLPDRVEEVDLTQRPFKIRYADSSYMLAETILIATGASAKWIGLASERRLRGRGVSSCATCDGFFFRGKKVAVVGGGDTAMEDALHLTRFAAEVILIHRRDTFRASKYMQQRVLDNSKITIRWNTVVTDVLGDESKGVTGLITSDTVTGEKGELQVDGLFVAIGHRPNTQFLNGQLPLDEIGFIKVDKGSFHTSVPGVFVAGDVIDPRYRQAITAAGMGCMAALEAQEFLATHPLS